MSDKHIKHPSDLFATGDIIEVRIKEVDLERKRISLTKRSSDAPKKPERKPTTPLAELDKRTVRFSRVCSPEDMSEDLFEHLED
jgi:uncharacterized protein